MRFVSKPEALAAWVCLLLSPWGIEAAEPAALRARLQAVVDAHPGKVAVAMKHLATGDEVAIRADEPMPTASLIKFPIMIAAYRLADAGQLDLGKPVVLREEDKVPGSGILTSHFSAGTQISLRDAIRLMIAYSDNTATNLVVDQIGLPTTARHMEQLGFPNTKLHAKVFRGETSIYPDRSKQFGLGSTTASEMVRLLEQVHRKQIATAESCERIREHLLACQDRDKFPRDLPPGIRVAHKTGSVTGVRTDAGLLDTPSGPIALCVLSAENVDKSWTRDNSGDVLCGRIARLVHDFYQPPATASPAETGPTKLAVGSQGALVESLQRTLNVRLAPSPDLSVDGEFGPVTKEAVARFQKQRQLPATGDVDSATWQALGPLVAEATPVPSPDVVNAEQLPVDRELSWSSPPLVTCKAWVIADSRTGVLLWGQQERQRLDFASTTKVMTAYLVLERAQREPAVLDEIVTFSRQADETPGSTADLKAGERVSVRELLYGLMLPSGNDAATALAEHFGGRCQAAPQESDPVARFVAEMNRTASRLGMRDTTYQNPHGLTAPRHQATAADLVVLARAAREIPLFREYTSTRQHGCTVSSVQGYTRHVVWKNTNKLLGFAGYSGVKTGTTDAAGACLVSAGRRGDDELLVVVLGSASSDARYVDTRNLFRWAWERRSN